ncbi:MAG: peptidoglycan editing factor PgeF [Candidatus Eisenbacteria sp.]|nr:peptidoglycan editing factor PgeF [Candidatus Eisenbacteria bacterium]
MKISDSHGVQFLQSELLADAALIHGFSTRLGGVSRGPYASLNLWHESGDPTGNVLENRSRLATALNIDPPELSTARQVHGDQVIDVRESFCDRSFDADGVVTDQAGVVLAVGTADCVPILLWDPEHHAIGAVHAGWKGAALGIARRAIRKMIDAFGSRPGGIRAAIGPAAGPCCYEVGPYVAGKFAPDYVVRLPGKRPHLDLWASNRHQLLEAGLTDAHIDMANLCTLCHPDLFFSYRRDNGVTGGMLSVIGLGEQATLSPLHVARPHVS